MGRLFVTATDSLLNMFSFLWVGFELIDGLLVERTLFQN